MQRIDGASLPLLLASVALLAAAWFVPAGRDPGAQGDIMLSMILAVRALVMPSSRWTALLGLGLTGIALSGNCGVLPGGGWRIAAFVVAAVMVSAFLLWDKLLLWLGRSGSRTIS